MKFWRWIRKQTGTESIAARLDGIDSRLDSLDRSQRNLNKKVVRKSLRYDQHERSRSQIRNQSRHH